MTPTTALPSDVDFGHSKIDALEIALLTRPDLFIDPPMVHRFTTNIYARQITMVAGSVWTSKQHRIQHSFVLLSGRVSVYAPGKPTIELSAPYIGITEPGTRRALFIHEDAVWVTFHPNPDNLVTLDDLEEFLIEERPSSPPAYRLYRTALDQRTLDMPTTSQLDYGGAP